MADEGTRGSRMLEWVQGRQRRKGLRPREAASLIVIAWFLAIIIFGVVEALVDSKTFPDVWLGMWWALQTVTTVGYGDVVPQSTAGRAIASILLLGGLAFLTVIIAMITGNFVARFQRQAIAAGEDPYLEAFERVAREVQELRAELRAMRGEGAPPAGGAPPTGSP
jgi:voltage-gated potassium channel